MQGFQTAKIRAGRGQTKTVPSTPTGLTATPTPGVTITLDWNDVTGAAVTGYKVYRSLTAGNLGSVIATPTASTYVDTVTEGVAYYYRVTAYNSSGESGYSSEVSATAQGDYVPPAWTLADVPGVDATVSASKGGAVPLTPYYAANDGTPYFSIQTITAAGGSPTTGLTINSSTGEISVDINTPADSYDVDIDLTDTSQAPVWSPLPTQGTVRRVPSQYATLQAAHDAAASGDTILLASNTYNESVEITKPLMIQGESPRPIIDTQHALLANDRGIIVIRESILSGSVIVENVELRGARGASRNAAGIRADAGLGPVSTVIRNCRIYDCENGILSGSDPLMVQGVNASLTMEWVDIENCAVWTPATDNTHQAYIGHIGNFIARYCQSRRGQSAGMHFKVRAKQSLIEYCRLDGEQSEYTSALIQYPNGGDHVVIGNLIVKGRESAPETTNGILVQVYGPEGQPWAVNRSVVAFNTFHSLHDGIGNSSKFIANPSWGSDCTANNNVFVYEGTNGYTVDAQHFTGSLPTTNTAVMPNRVSGDYRLASSAAGYTSVALAAVVTAPQYQLSPQWGGAIRVRGSANVQGAYEDRV